MALQTIDRIEIDGDTYLFEDSVAKEEAARVGREMATYANEIKSKVSQISAECKAHVNAVKSDLRADFINADNKVKADAASEMQALHTAINDELAETLDDVKDSNNETVVSVAALNNEHRLTVEEMCNTFYAEIEDIIEEIQKPATQETKGLMLPSDKAKLDNIDMSAIESVSPMQGATETGNGSSGLVPAPIAGDNTKFLRGDGAFADIPKYALATDATDGLMSANDKVKLDSLENAPIMGGATSSVDGTAGLVPAPTKAERGKFLKGDGTFDTPHDTTYGLATTSAAGLMSASDKIKLNDLENAPMMAGATSVNNGSAGMVPAPSVSDRNKFFKGDGTYQAIPNASTSTAGLMTATDKTKLDGLENAPLMVGATYLADGSSGLVPSPLKAEFGKYLRGDGKWHTPTNTTYSPVTQSNNGLMIASDKTKLDSLDEAFAVGSFAVNTNGSYTETLGNGKTCTTTFNTDGTLTQAFTGGGSTKTVKTTFTDTGFSRAII